METKEKTSSPHISIVILALTGLGYAVAYLFEWAYLRYFGINYKFIELSPQIIVISVLLTVGGYFIFSAMFRNVTLISHTINRGPVSSYFAKGLSINFVILIILFLLFRGLGIDDFYCLSFSLIIVLSLVITSNLESVIWMLKRKNIRKGLLDFHKDVENMYKRQATQSPSMILDYYTEYILATIVILSIGFYCGRMFASIDSTHLPVISSSNNVTRVLIERSGDMLLTKDYDEKKRKFIDGYSLIKISDTTPLSISKKKDITK